MGVVAGSVEDDLLAIGMDVEAPHRRLITQPGELTTLFRRQIQKPEILREGESLQVDQAGTVGQEPGSGPAPSRCTSISGKSTAVPSGRMAWSGACEPTLAPV